MNHRLGAALVPLALLTTSLLVTACSTEALPLVADGGQVSDGVLADGLASDAAGTDTVVPTLSYAINDTAQTSCYDAAGAMTCPAAGSAFDGQDAQYGSGTMSFRDNGDGTVTDLRTGLIWAKARGEQVTYAAALAGAKTFNLAGQSDWRMPTIKELYSLIDFRGASGQTAATSTPYIDTNAFEIAFGDTSAGERLIDAQDWSATRYVGTTMNGDPTVFGVNFIDGRIKGYPEKRPDGVVQTHYVRYVRGNPSYGQNKLVDQGDDTIADEATGLVWQKGDSGKALSWEGALAYCEGLSLAGASDWRLPNAKELQSIVDYTRAPLITQSAAIDPTFDVTEVESYFWSSTTHLEGAPEKRGQQAVYVCFGRALGFMEQPPGSGNYAKLDVHGAGAQRSDPKSGDPSAFPHGNGPQGDDIRIYNYARCVRDR